MADRCRGSNQAKVCLAVKFRDLSAVADRPVTRVARTILLTTLLLAAAVPIAAPPVSANQNASEAEQHALDLINQARVGEGKVALRWDSRLADIAQWRSDYQVVNGFGHLSSWEPILSRMDSMGIVHYGYGEVLVLGTPRTPLESAEEAVATWQASPSHWDWLSSPDFNYVALGVTRATNGWYYWTGLLLKGPDRTPPQARIVGSQLGDRASGKQRVTVSWTGADVPLSVLTAGIRDFKLQKRIGSGRWRTVLFWTNTTVKSLYLRTGRNYSFRVRARDMAGNRSIWSGVLRVAL